jgi:general secretion pathway protein L
MKMFDFGRGLSRWLDLVAETVVSLLAAFRKEQTVCMQEGELDCFTLAKAAAGGVGAGDDSLRVEHGRFVQRPSSALEIALHRNRLQLLVRPDRFVFKPLELPSRAVEFLSGVVRAQIDRLTPWSADQALFGYSEPAEAGQGRIVVTVAATAKSLLDPIVGAFSELGARSIVVCTAAPELPSTTPDITVTEQNVARALDV